MDSRDNFLSKLREYIVTINDEYLISVTNKGIFNRAVKDLDANSKIKVTIEDSAIKCELPDDNICLINDDIKNYKCSCPSRNVCKHTIMSYLYVRKHLDEIFGQSVENTENTSQDESIQDFSELLSIDLKSINKLIGEKEFRNIIKRFSFGLKAEFEEGNLLQVKFKEEETIVKFISLKINEKKDNIEIQDSILMKNSLCSCKSKEICKHKVEAVIHYGIYKGKFDKDKLEAFIKQDISINKKTINASLIEIKKIINEIYITGLSRMSENFADEIEQAAIICHNNDLPNFEKRLRALQTNLKLYLNKNAAFSIKSFRKLIQDIYMTAILLENCDEEEKLVSLIGQHKSTYYEIPSIELICIGANKWIAKSGYEGITNYFISPIINKWFTYTNSRAIYYDNINRVNNYESSPWGISDKYNLFCKSKIKLINGKVNDEFRLSSSENSKGQIIGNTNVSSIYVKDKTFNDWKSLLSTITEVSLMDDSEREENDNLFLIKVTSFEKCKFDNILQEFSMGILDKDNRMITISLKYGSQNKKIIEHLERMEKLKYFPFMFLSKIYIEDNGLIAIPITAYYENGNIQNLTMD